MPTKQSSSTVQLYLDDCRAHRDMFLTWTRAKRLRKAWVRARKVQQNYDDTKEVKEEHPSDPERDVKQTATKEQFDRDVDNFRSGIKVEVKEEGH